MVALLRYLLFFGVSVFLRMPTCVISQRAELISNSTVLEGKLCPIVQLRCIVEDLPTLRWFFDGVEGVIYLHTLDNTIPPAIELNNPFPGISIQIINVTQGSTLEYINAVSLLTANVSAIQQLQGQRIQCGSNVFKSEAVTVGAITALDIPPSTDYFSCSLSPSFGSSLHVIFQWSPSFNTQYRVERYNVTVTPDPSSCSSDQVSPSEDYSCFGLNTEDEYIISVSAINCGHQEGESVTFTQHLVPGIPRGLNVQIDGSLLIIEWMQPRLALGRCSFSRPTNYTLCLEDSMGETVYVNVSSDSCRNGTCSTNYTPSTLICRVSIMARNEFNASHFNIDISKLSRKNLLLLGFGVSMLMIAIQFLLCTGVIKCLHGAVMDRLLLIIYFGNIILLVISSILWVSVAFQVELQKNTCDASWQSIRNILIIVSFIFTTITLLFGVVIFSFLVYKNYMGKFTKDSRDQGAQLIDYDDGGQFRLKGEYTQTANKRLSMVLCHTMLKYNRHLKSLGKTERVERMIAWLPDIRKWNDHLSKTEALKVFFMNDCHILWDVTQDFLMQILNDSWTGCFTLGNEETHHIRVKFEDNDFSNWTVMGVPALDINKSKPTMSLNFRSMNNEQIRATVVHQFGHALGFGHALMRPQDFNAIREFVNVDAMVKSYGAKNKDEFEIQWTGKGMSEKAEYYDDSVMRYSTDLLWLLKNVSKDHNDLKIFKEHAELKHNLSSQDRISLMLLRYGNTAIIDVDFLTSNNNLAAYWFTIGKFLEVEENKLTSIKAEGGDKVLKLNKVWDQWICSRSDPPTMNGLYSLLRDKNATELIMMMAIAAQ